MVSFVLFILYGDILYIVFNFSTKLSEYIPNIKNYICFVVLLLMAYTNILYITDIN